MKQDDFDNLLAWLHPNRDLAAQKYREIHGGLVKLFAWRGYFDAEELADEAMNRVSLKGGKVFEDYVGEPANYFFGVANIMLLELLRRPPPQPLPPDLESTGPPSPDEPDNAAVLRKCLKKCLRKLDAGEREQILSYYRMTKQAKIDYHKVMAERLGIVTNALRVRVYRIRQSLKDCVQACFEKKRLLK